MERKKLLSFSTSYGVARANISLEHKICSIELKLTVRHQQLRLQRRLPNQLVKLDDIQLPFFVHRTMKLYVCLYVRFQQTVNFTLRVCIIVDTYIDESSFYTCHRIQYTHKSNESIGQVGKASFPHFQNTRVSFVAVWITSLRLCSHLSMW